ncbi:DNA-3-methyladenine glycosylase [Bacillus sp. HMF5848]|uniref:DNA-3-methyladenine glycosylase n=1 Tax=Bacillus sp. HMF5848 TaxID=2495421 RepID=UPI000F7890B5|nr:DNA-3-methyladenine glycosylase [Bacillus sp. HMF5848]RSK27717.1 DNA-3-methyladenine glycosylase [Bacillus sp. HMF5848]
MKIADATIFQLPTLELSKKLLGMELCHRIQGKTISGKIVEVEAYKGPEDKASHSYGGRRTARTEVMYGPPGYAYVYLIYGMHYCFNIVSGPTNKPEAILIRALQPTEGIEQMATFRKTNLVKRKDSYALTSLRSLTNGPGKLAQALSITKELYGHKLTEPPLFIRGSGLIVDDNEIASGPRINIDYAEEAVHYPWRFWIKNNPFVSKK